MSVADVLWVETMIRRGQGGECFPVRPPYRPGAGVAGTVGTVGAGVDPGWTGRRVVTRTDERGGYLERAVAGRIAPLVGQTFPLHRAADPHRAIEERAAIGKTLLTV
ncbi:hypothetical protein ABZ793_21565 [Micromonospora sp. NPDC047465]|uniref:hypothetical protein n=1 Tax=Micromonospora sp. NPDC047465 TaxID=3154813 RepID=UPI0033F45FE2